MCTEFNITRFMLAALIAMALPVASALAQAIPGGAEPGRLEQQFAPPPMPRAIDEPLLPKGEEPLPPEQAEKIRFSLSGITLQGNTVFSESELSEIYQPYLGQEVSLATIYTIANEISARYRNAGFVLTRVTPPAQRVSNGVVTLLVTEGYIDTIEIEGAVKGNKDLIDAYIKKIMASSPLNNRDLERYILLINDLPGIKAKAILIPSFEKQGASNMVLQVFEDPWDAMISVDNRGTEFIGSVQYRAQGGLNSYFGRSERISAQVINTQEDEELRFFDIGYAEPFGSEGTVAGISGNISWSNPGSTLAPFDVEGQNRSITAVVSHPWLRSRKKNLSFRGSISFRNSHTDLRDALLTEDRLRIVRAGASADFADHLRGINLFDVEVSQGLDIFNASRSGTLTLTRPSGREDFTKITASAMRIQQITQPIQLVLGANAQYAVSQLLASEEFGYGGLPFGRAYDPSQLTGDHGLAIRAEGQYHVPYQDGYLKSLDLYTFYDIGSVWHIDTSARERRDSAASAGIGARFTIQQRLIGYVEVADPLSGTVPARGDHGNNPRFFFSLSAPF